MSTFKDLNIPPLILENINTLGYNSPTQIQSLTINPATEGQDILGIAQTGTGKTAAFIIPLITKLLSSRAKARLPRGLILTPTRELAAQVNDFFESLAKQTNLTKVLLIGGVSYQEQEKLLDVGVDVLIGTPGRIHDHLERQNIMLHGIQSVIIDEADRMLDEGFMPQVKEICSRIPAQRQTLFFSATMNPDIEALTQSFLRNPVRVEISPPASVSNKIKQIGYYVKGNNEREEFNQKTQALHRVITELGSQVKNAIIFCNTKNKVDTLRLALTSKGLQCSSIHGDHPQAIRTSVLDKFREGDPPFLVASDVASRGLDISFVSHVFNLDVPNNPEDYIHRIGRTGRAGKRGVAITFCGQKETKTLKAIEKLMNQEIIMQDTEQLIQSSSTHPADAPTKRPARSRRKSRVEGRSSRNIKAQSLADSNDSSRGVGKSSQHDTNQTKSQQTKDQTGSKPIKFKVEKNTKESQIQNNNHKTVQPTKTEIKSSSDAISAQNGQSSSHANTKDEIGEIPNTTEPLQKKNKKRKSKRKSNVRSNEESINSPSSSHRSTQKKNDTALSEVQERVQPKTQPSRRHKNNHKIGFEGRTPAFIRTAANRN